MRWLAKIWLAALLLNIWACSDNSDYIGYVTSTSSLKFSTVDVVINLEFTTNEHSLVKNLSKYNVIIFCLKFVNKNKCLD